MEAGSSGERWERMREKRGASGCGAGEGGRGEGEERSVGRCWCSSLILMSSCTREARGEG